MEKRRTLSLDGLHIGGLETRLCGRSFAVVTAEGGIEFCSAALGSWLDAARRDAIRSYVRGLESEGATSAFVTAGAKLSSIRLGGAQGVRFLVICEAVEDSLQCDGLTRRQMEIAEYAAAGATAKEIAKSLQISPLTVKTHLRSIYERLDVGNRIELAEALKPRN
jgi:DNA-binding CsgD family transcriptional regulator